MGGNTFIEIVEGDNEHQAFQDAVRSAQYEYGHGGYTGTIAEKSEFVVIPMISGDITPLEYVEKLIDEDDKRIEDKWGPAGCIRLGDNRFLFFGWASS